jgi:succinoglycan biosynthesis protein ExoV
MFLHYHHAPQGNFGDDLNGWLWNRLLPPGWDADDGIVLVGIGTIIGRFIPDSRRYLVFGSGAGYQSPPRGFGDSRWDIASVRGPLTAQALGLPPTKAVTDGAALLALLPEYTPLSPAERSGVLFMPHHYALETGKWREVCALAGIDFLDPRDESRKSIQRIRRARLVLADAMHAAIVADTLRVPWIPLVTSPEINTFKWQDWTRSLGLPYEPVLLPASTRLESFRSKTLSLRGRKFASLQPAGDTHLADFRRLQNSDDSIPWRIISLFNRCLLDHALHPLLRGGLRVTGSGDDSSLAVAAAVMSSTAKKPSYLSHDRIFAQRVDQLSLLLERVGNSVK